MAGLAYRITAVTDEAAQRLPASIRADFRWTIGQLRNEVARPVLECRRTKDALQLIHNKQGTVGIALERLTALMNKALQESPEFAHQSLADGERGFADLVERSGKLWGEDAQRVAKRAQLLQSTLIRMVQDWIGRVDVNSPPAPSMRLFQRVQARTVLLHTIAICLLFADVGDVPKGRSQVCQALLRHLHDALEDQVFDMSAMLRPPVPPAPAEFVAACARVAAAIQERSPGIDPVKELFEAREEERTRED
jgi:hypothetical protein